MAEEPCASSEDPPACLLKAIRVNVLGFSIASCVSSILLLALYSKHQRVRRMPGWVMSRASCCELLSSLCFILLCFAGDPWQRPYAQTLSSLVMVAEAGAFAWRLVMFLHLVSIYFNPFNPDKHRFFYPTCVLLLASLSAGPCCVYLASAPQDSKAELVRLYFSTMTFAIFVLPFMIFAFLGAVLNITIRVLSCGAGRAAKRNKHSTCISKLARQRAMKHSTAYLLLYAVQLSAGLCLAALLAWGPPRLEHAMRRWLVVLGCGRPAISLVGWLLINDVFYVVFGVCSLFKRQDSLALPARPMAPVELADATALGSLGLVGAELGTPVLAARRAPPAPSLLGLGAGHSSESVVSVSELRSRTSSWMPMDLQERFKDVKELMARRATELHGIEEVGFKEELRFELLYDVAHGIGALAHEELIGPAHQAVKARTGPAEDAASSFCASATQAELPLDAAHLSRPPRLLRSRSDDAQAGTWSRLTTGGAARSADRDASRAGDGEEGRGGPPPRRACVQHYDVEDFRAIRVAFGISAAAYARTFPSDLSSSDPTWRRRLKESVSEGASGSFFYRVLSNCTQKIGPRYIIKQISKKEKDVLVALLPPYRAYVTSRRGRSLIQYFACHSVSLWWNCSGKVYFVVMRDFLPVPQWLRFDLKGAVKNRRALAADLLHQIHAGEDPRGGAAWGTLRDWEWMDIAMVCDISAEDKDSLAEIITADAAFLCAQGLIDYSLLVGIHRLGLKSAADREQRLEELRAIGGYASLDRQRVYFFGIIDILETYNMAWRVQRCVATTAYCCICRPLEPDGITAMPPAEYASRFTTFVCAEVLHVPEPAAAATAAAAAAAAVAARRHGAAPPMDAAALAQQASSPLSMSFGSAGLARQQLRNMAARRGISIREGKERRGAFRCLCGGGGSGAAASAAGAAGAPVSARDRWVRLWQRRRRGLMRERLEVERSDHLRRIADLEAQLKDMAESRDD